MMSDFASRSRQRPSASAQALSSYGFRPLFLAAGLYAVLAMGLWLAWLALGAPNCAMFGNSPFAWHAHEMIFGFAAAAVAGFLLTAVPNWTGALPLSGSPLAVLFATWLTGRIANSRDPSDHIAGVRQRLISSCRTACEDGSM